MPWINSKKVIPKTKLSTKQCTLPITIGATSGTRNVRTVGIDSNFADRDPIKVEVRK